MAVTYDSLLDDKVGSLGAWQWTLFFFITITCTPPVLQIQQLILMTPTHFCDQPQLRAAGWSNDQILNATVPRLPSTGDFDSCHQLMLSDSFSNLSEELPVITNSTPVPCQHGWTYVDDGRTMLFPLSREFDLVCNHKMLVSLLGSAYMLGMIPGPPIAGFLSDRYGRKLVCMIFSLLAGCAGIASAYLSTSVAVFWVLRFLLGCLSSAANVTCYVHCAELTTVRLQNIYNLVFHLCCDLFAGAFYISTTYLAQDWRLTTAIVSIPHFFAVVFPFLVPESPRWLLSVDKRKEALSVLKKASEVNQRCRCSSKRKPRDSDSWDMTSLMQSLFRHEEEKEVEDEARITWQTLFTNKLYLARFLCMTFLWTSIANVAYSLLFFAVRLKGNPYVISTILIFFLIPGIIIKTVIYHFFSRKAPLLTAYVLTFLLTSLCALILHFLPNHWLSVALATASYACAHVVFIMLFTVTPAIFPTGIRNLAMGLLYGLCRVGCALAPFVEKLDTISGQRWLPLVLMASLMSASLVACGLMKFPTTCETEFTLDAEMEKGEEEEELKI